MLIFICAKRPSEEGAPPWVGDRTMWKFYLSGRFEKIAEYCRDSDFANVSVQ